MLDRSRAGERKKEVNEEEQGAKPVPQDMLQDAEALNALLIERGPLSFSEVVAAAKSRPGLEHITRERLAELGNKKGLLALDKSYREARFLPRQLN